MERVPLIIFVGGITNLESSIISVAQRASVAERTGIDKFIKYSMKPGSRSPKVLALAIDAIVGAVYVDSTDFNDPWKVALKLGLVSKFLGSSAPPAQPVPDIHDPSSSFNHRDTVEDMEISLQPILSAGTPHNPDMPPPNGIIEEELISALTSGHILPSPVNEFSYFELPMTEDDPVWTSLQGPSNGDQFGPEYSGDVSGRQESCEFRGMERTQDNPPPVARDSEEDLVTFSDLRSNCVENSHGRPMRGHHYQAPLIDDWLNSFLDEENKKCQSHQYPLPFETFFAPPIQTALIGMGAHAKTLTKFLVHIASAETLVTLRHIVLSYRERPSPILFGTRPGLSEKERFNIIGLLGTEISWCRLLRMYHILELYETCKGTDCAEKLIVTTLASFQGRKRKAGNPFHAAEAEITERMMKSIFPDLLHGTNGYKQKKASLKRVRKLGQRLHILVTEFGSGILGLMLNEDMKGLEISEQM